MDFFGGGASEKNSLTNDFFFTYIEKSEQTNTCKYVTRQGLSAT